MYFNGSYTLKGAGAGVVLIPLKGDILKYDIQIEFLTTNNIIEYEGLVTGLRLAKDMHSATPYQGWFTASSQASTERIWLQ
jgi:ribonuclease HI